MRRLLLAITAVGFCATSPAQNWSAWSRDSVFPGIEVRERCGGFNEFANRYLWDVQIRNSYEKSVNVAWATEPEKLHGAEAQADHALAIKPGEVIGTHHTALADCSTRMSVRVTDVTGAVAGPASTNPPKSAGRTDIEGRWRSKDADPHPKELIIHVSGNTVTSSYSSPQFSLQVTAPIPERLNRSISIEKSDRK
jgi:hypothetical protein